MKLPLILNGLNENWISTVSTYLYSKAYRQYRVLLPSFLIMKLAISYILMGCHTCYSI